MEKTKMVRLKYFVNALVQDGEWFLNINILKLKPLVVQPLVVSTQPFFELKYTLTTSLNIYNFT